MDEEGEGSECNLRRQSYKLIVFRAWSRLTTE